jgi:peptidoglycan-N-acetylglucosamine deacetylase
VTYVGLRLPFRSAGSERVVTLTFCGHRPLATDIQQGLDAFAVLGLRPLLYRPPWLFRIPALRGIARGHRLRVISGEFCHALEAFQPAPERIARRALAKTRPGSILIFHDGFDGRGGDRDSTVEAVKIVVRVC